jgi:hypothetical protein
MHDWRRRIGASLALTDALISIVYPLLVALT